MNFNLVCLACGQGNRIPQEKLDAGPKCAVCGTALIKAEPTDISFDVLVKATRIDSLPLIVDFWADWCGPCKMMAPEYAKASKKLTGVARCAKLDTQAYPQAGNRYDIRGIPLLIAFGAGHEIKRQSGAISAEKILVWASDLPATGAGAP